jgi:hypothetical protein
MLFGVDSASGCGPNAALSNTRLPHRQRQLRAFHLRHKRNTGLFFIVAYWNPSHNAGSSAGKAEIPAKL